MWFSASDLDLCPSKVFALVKLPISDDTYNHVVESCDHWYSDSKFIKLLQLCHVRDIMQNDQDTLRTVLQVYTLKAIFWCPEESVPSYPMFGGNLLDHFSKFSLRQLCAVYI